MVLQETREHTFLRTVHSHSCQRKLLWSQLLSSQLPEEGGNAYSAGMQKLFGQYRWNYGPFLFRPVPSDVTVCTRGPPPARWLHLAFARTTNNKRIPCPLSHVFFKRTHTKCLHHHLLHLPITQKKRSVKGDSRTQGT